MASILTLKRRIKTAQNVSKTTRAMQMIAASKLKRAQEAALSSRPYVEKLSSLCQNLTEKVEEKDQHNYMKGNIAENTLLIVLAPDKGLCGGLITNLTREYLRLTSNKYFLITIGKKTEKVISLSKNEVVASFPFGTTLPLFDMIYPVSKIVDDYFLNKKVSSVQIVSTKLQSIFVQKPMISTILPIRLLQETESKEKVPFELFEPQPSEILPDLLRHYLEMVLYQHFLESYLSEQAARMISMQNATDNAKDIIIGLTLEYNKVRQEKITNEILDITSSSVFNYEQ